MAPKIRASDAGCWLDGCRGWHNTYRVIDLAIEFDWLQDDPEELQAVQALANAYAYGNRSDDVQDVIHDCANDATEYLQSLAPEGYYFEWDAGELSLVAAT